MCSAGCSVLCWVLGACFGAPSQLPAPRRQGLRGCVPALPGSLAPLSEESEPRAVRGMTLRARGPTTRPEHPRTRCPARPRRPCLALRGNTAPRQSGCPVENSASRADPELLGRVGAGSGTWLLPGGAGEGESQCRPAAVSRPPPRPHSPSPPLLSWLPDPPETSRRRLCPRTAAGGGRAQTGLGLPRPSRCLGGRWPVLAAAAAAATDIGLI